MSDPTPIPLSTFLAEARTGDVVLWKGTSLDSLAVECISESSFSHTSMVIVDPTTGQKCLLQSVSEALGPDPLVGGKTHTGVQAGDLAATMATVYKFGDLPVWRRYTPAAGAPGLDKPVWQLATQLDGTPFPKELWELAILLVSGRELKQEVLDPLFCSGLVAHVLQKAGVIAPTSPCNGYFPKDFSSAFPGHFDVVAGTYADDVSIDMG